MSYSQARAALLAALLLALPLLAPAYERDGGQADDRLVDKFARFAGSKSNAESLVAGLRDDRQVKLASDKGSTSFTPSTGKLGFGNVDIALSLAKATLAEQGIHRPTPEQIKAALEGGTITTKSGARVTLPGILKQRASGMGWGKIAQANGFKLGEVMRHRHERAHHRDHDRDHRHHARHHEHDRGDFRHTRFERHERPHRVERVERFERHHRG
jgi:hypothetical protein